MSVIYSANAIIYREGKLLLFRRAESSVHGAGLWCLPGGKFTLGIEKPWAACRREVREETELEMSVGKYLGRLIGNIDITRRELFVNFYFVPSNVSGMINLNENEFSEYAFFEGIPDDMAFMNDRTALTMLYRRNSERHDIPVRRHGESLRRLANCV